MSFELEPVLKAAHKEWGRYFEKHAVQRLGSEYRPVMGLQRWDFDIDMGKKGQVDFLGVGNGIEAWQAFAKDYKAYMHNATYTKLQKPHFLIAEIGLTTQTLKKKFDDNATSLLLLQSFVSSVESHNLNAVKCLVYDGADAEDFTKCHEARKFMDQGGILINIPYLSAETVLDKLNETTKLREEIRQLLNRSGMTSTSSPSSVVWARELARNQDGTVTAKSRQEEPAGEEELERAFKVQSREGAQLNDVDDLATAIKQKKSNALRDVDPDQIDIYLRSKEAGEWQLVEFSSTSLRQDTSEQDCYGFLPRRAT